MGFEQLTWDTTKDAITIGLSLEPLVMIAFKCLFLLFFPWIVNFWDTFSCLWSFWDVGFGYRESLDHVNT